MPLRYLLSRSSPIVVRSGGAMKPDEYLSHDALSLATLVKKGDVSPTEALHDALSLATLVKKGDVSPRELLDAAIARLEEQNPRINAVIHRLDEEARRVA